MGMEMVKVIIVKPWLMTYILGGPEISKYIFSVMGFDLHAF